MMVRRILLTLSMIALAAPAAARAQLFAAPQVLDAGPVGFGETTALPGPNGAGAVTWLRASGGHTYVLGAVRPAGGPIAAAKPQSNAYAYLRQGHASAIAPDGSLHTVWLSEGRRPSVLTGDPTSPTTLDTPTVGPVRVALGIGADGTEAAAWMADAGPLPVFSGGIVRASVKPPGGSWSAPAELQTAASVGQLSGPAVGVDGAGNVTVAWPQDGGRAQIVAVAYRPAGGSFQAPQTLSVEPYGAIVELELITRPDGTQTIAATEGGFSRVHVRDGDHGHFGPDTVPAAIPTSTLADLRMSSNDRGDVALVFTGGQTATTYERTHLSYRPAGGTWSPPQAIGGCGGTIHDVAVTPGGAALAVFEQRPGTDSPPGRLTRSTLFATLRRPDGRWSSPQQISPAGSDVLAPSVAAVDNGRILLGARVDKQILATVTNAPLDTLEVPAADDGTAAPYCAIPPQPPIIVPTSVTRLAPAVRLTGTLDARRRRLTATVRCPAGGPACQGVVAMLQRRRTLAIQEFDLLAGRRARLVLRPPRSLRLRRQTFTLAAATAGADGSRTVVRRAIRARR